MKTILLAAGEGKRMKTERAKTLHKILDKPILQYVLEASIGDPVVVIGHRGDDVKQAIGESIAERGEAALARPVSYVVQQEQLGSGHAVMAAASLISPEEDVLVVCGDTPLVTRETLTRLVDTHRKNRNGVTGYSTIMDEPFGYGRIIRQNGHFMRIVEQKDLADDQQEVNEINAAIYVFDGALLLSALKDLKNDNAQNEYYLTDAVEIIKKGGYRAEMLVHDDPDEFIGINTRVHLAQATEIMKTRINLAHMANGVTLIDPGHTYIGSDVEIGPDTVVYPGSMLMGRTVIGRGCIIGANCSIENTHIADDVNIQYSVAVNAAIGSHTSVGPFANLRPDSQVGAHCRVGNFVEVKNASIGDYTKAGHLTYIGDADVGSHINFGCGTITVNYDGKNKHRTKIEDNVFIGSNSNLVAPVTLKAGAFIAAGSTITDDVPEQTLSIARARQVNKPDWKKKSDGE